MYLFVSVGARVCGCSYTFVYELKKKKITMIKHEKEMCLEEKERDIVTSLFMLSPFF